MAGLKQEELASSDVGKWPFGVYWGDIEYAVLYPRVAGNVLPTRLPSFARGHREIKNIKIKPRLSEEAKDGGACCSFRVSSVACGEIGLRPMF